MAPVSTFLRFLANDDGIFCAFRYFATVRLAKVMASCATYHNRVVTYWARGSSASTNLFILYFIEVADVLSLSSC